MPGFLEALGKGAFVLDGAMGTALYERGLLYASCLDEASVSRPDVVRQVHEAHLRAGADALLTNSFGANRIRLESHGFADRVEAINRAAVSIARDVATGGAFVLASVGPTGLLLPAIAASEIARIEDAFREQCAALVAAGVDGIVLETFYQSAEIEIALRAARAEAKGLPVVASVSFGNDGTMRDGTGPEEMAAKLRDLGADAISVNCSDGPAGVYEMVVRMLSVDRPVLALPNAGLPQRVEGRLAYMATPDYFQLYARRLYKAGVHGVGGCCGTTAEHVKKIAAAARMLGGGSSGDGGGMRSEEPGATTSIAPGATVVPTSEKGELGAKLGKRFVVSVEVNPPPGLALDKALEGARRLREGGVDVINVADGPRASARMGNLALCVRIQEKLGMPALLHVTTRDRNLLGLVAHLLSAHELGVRNLVVITGDPPKMGDFPDATPVYDLDSIGLLRLVAGLNRGFDPGGKPTGAATSFLSATGAEPAASDYEREMARLRLKIDAGAELVMTQPVYDPDVLDRFLRDVAPLGVPVLVGLLPLASHRNAEFLHNEVPGMRVPESIRERMRKAGSGDAGRREGVAIAREMLQSVRERVAGAYVMPPFGRYELALDVIEGLVR